MRLLLLLLLLLASLFVKASAIADEFDLSPNNYNYERRQQKPLPYYIVGGTILGAYAKLTESGFSAAIESNSKMMVFSMLIFAALSILGGTILVVKLQERLN